jgi:hypothetical protein
MTAKVSRLGDVAEIEAQMFGFEQKFNQKTELEFSTSAAIFPNRCCRRAFLLDCYMSFRLDSAYSLYKSVIFPSG